MSSNNETRAQTIMRVMASMGFQPKADIDSRYVEFYKDYAEPHGRVARCTVLFNKGGIVAGMEHAQLSKFIVTVQGAIDPVLEEVTAKAPAVMHDDMLHSMRALEGVGIAPSINTVSCGVCGNDTSEFVISKSGVTTCPACLKNTLGNPQQ